MKIIGHLHKYLGKKVQPSVKYNSIKLIIKIIKKYPDLNTELKFMTESPYMESLSDAFKKSISKMILGLK